MSRRTDWDTRIQDYVDGRLTPEETRETETHLETHPEAREHLEFLRSLKTAARSLRDREFEPARDLWPDIRRSALGEEPAAGWGSRLAVAALAAALVVAYLAGPVSPPGGTPPVTARVQDARGFQGVIQAMELECRGAGKQVLAALHGGGLQESTAASITAGLTVIDQAIVETRAALAADPGNRDLLEILVSRYQRKLGVLHGATRLAASA
jgi:hypothetical protein